MPKTDNARTRAVAWGRTVGVVLRKRFGRTGDVIELLPEEKPPGGKPTPVLVLPVQAVDRLIAALLELKVLMKDGGTYNSGVLRVQLVDGSGVPCEIEELTETGRQLARGAAEQLIEEIDDAGDIRDLEDEPCL
jgi:hypothetical protein